MQSPALLLHRALPVVMTEHVVEKRQLIVLVSWKPSAQDAAQLDMTGAGMPCCSGHHLILVHFSKCSLCPVWSGIMVLRLNLQLYLSGLARAVNLSYDLALKGANVSARRRNVSWKERFTGVQASHPAQFLAGAYYCVQSPVFMHSNASVAHEAMQEVRLLRVLCLNRTHGC